MDKEAVDYLNLALMSLLAGAGGYGGMRMLKDIPNEGLPPEKPKNELEITLPSARIPKMAAESVSDILMPAVTGLGGAGLGFFGASSIYEAIKKKQMENQMKQVQQNYMNTLQQAHAKVAEMKTPLTDNFIKGLIAKTGAELEKSGWVDPSFVGNQHTVAPLMQGGFDAATDNDLGRMFKATMAALMLGGAGATYGIAKKMDANREENKIQSTLPTDVKLHVTQ